MEKIAATVTLDAPVRQDRAVLPDAFRTQARRTPQALAVLTAAGERLTYAELDRWSDRLARFLVRQGLGPEAPVGVCLERSLELVIALLAVLKAGAVYLPLDPAYPANRLSAMLEDSGAPLVLTRTKWMPAVAGGVSLAVALDAPGGLLESEPGGAEMPHIEPENLAYLIYTSGSTGRPKGVGVAHAEAAEHLGIVARLLDLAEGERLLQFSSPSFDMAMEEILAPLLSGAAVVLRAAELWQPGAFLDRVGELGVTVVNLPTAYWHSWSAELERAILPEGLALRLVMLGGEAMSGESARRWRRSPLAHLRVLNGYGPTEGVITATVFEVDSYVGDAADAVDAAGAVAIGRPLDGRSTQVLDPHGLPVPQGDEGELCLGGSLLARGYLGRPDATAERFVPDPFSDRPGNRLYRTGDRVRQRPDGVLEFLGRIDRQVKVRGFRVEPGEVEAALARHPEVREVAVDPRPDAAGGIRLVAWIVSVSPASAPLSGELREFLGETLPEHMIPSAFVTLAELPLTPNGKIDYSALPEPKGDWLGGYTAPATPTEERLAGLWAETLGCARVGVQDSFFALGGHSLLGMRVLARVRDLFGVDLPLAVLLGEPTVAAMARALEAVRRDPHGSGPRLAPVPYGGLLPLSPAQQGLWFLDRLEPGRPVYNIASAAALNGPLDPAALAAAFGAVIRRHEPLRTRFLEMNGEPRQEILPPEPFLLPRIDLSVLAPGSRRSELERLGREGARRAFDLARGPLLRACLATLAASEHVLFVAVHHIVFDGWSEGVFWQDLSASYAGALLPEPPVRYADYAVWQQRRLEGTLDAEVEWWRRQLDGVEPLELPTDRPRPAVRTWSGDVRSWTLPAPLAGAVRELAFRQGTTPFVALLAAFSALLSRTSGQDSFAVGAPVAGRGPSELEGLIGMFVNMLALRADLSGRPTLRDLIRQMRQTVLAALAHLDVPFDRLVQELNPERDLGRNPVFQVSFQVVDEARPLPAFPGIRASAPGFHSATSKFDLELSLEDPGGENAEIRGECEYSTDLFDSSTIERFLARFELLTEEAVAAPDLPLAELPLLSESERRQLLEWNATLATLAETAPAGLVHRLFEEQARRQPAAPAVGELTYAGLDGRAITLARRLRELGVGPEVRVGVCLERSPELVVAVLAVLKAGGVYVALDPSHPTERLAFQLEDSRAPVVVARRELAAGIRLVFPDEAPETDLDLNGPEPSPANLAYVIYTSGSTGRPKGVELTHGSLRSLVSWHVRAFGLTPADRSALIAGVGFDASVWEVWPALAAGASLHVVPETVRTSPEAVRDWLVEQGVTVTFLPTPLAEAVLTLEWPRGAAMRSLLAGGDRLHRPPSPSLPFVLVNNYGPTEGTVVSTSGAVTPTERWDRAPSIGRPIDGTGAFVVDRERLPVPPGIPGELLVGGAGLARGYAGRPDLTAERFIPDSLSGRKGERLYRTGDMVRFLPSGELEFLGRIDFQVKVRGYRIEPGEIETALARHPQVREAAVLVLDGNLVAWVACTAPEGEPAELEAFLRHSLPDYMLPSVIVPLPALPLNASGKVDRQALARIASPAVAAGRAFAAPVEELVARVWEEVLDRADVQPGDNFFQLGGHSLLATRVLSRLREALGVELPLQALFESPTVAALARVVAAARQGAVAVLPPLLPVARGGLLPLSFPQQRLWFVDRLAPDNPTYNVPSAFRLAGPLDPAALAGALTAVVRRHEALRTRFVEGDVQPWQEILPAAPCPLPLADLGALPEECRQGELARLGRAEAARPFDLRRGPLLRAGLVRLGAEEHALLLTLHHIASDGWSEEILQRELGDLYAAAQAGTSGPPEIPLQYADFAVWQRTWPEAFLDRQLAWWTGTLAELATLEVPTDRPRPPAQTFRGALETLAVPPELTAALRGLSRSRGATQFMTLLAGWQALFHRVTGQADVAVGSPVANRNRPEIEGLIGFFVNMLALRTDFGGDPGFGEAVERVRRVALAAYDHADVPFERLVDELSPGRDLSRQPLVQVMFGLETGLPPLPSLAGLEVTALDFAGMIAKFDLTLGLFDRGDELSGWIEYNTDLFDRVTVARLAGHLVNLLAGVAAAPDAPLSRVELLSAPERHQLLREWNDTVAPFPAGTLMHQFFEAAVDRAPEALAAVWEDRELTYGGLEARANRIARLLRDRGAGRDMPVGVWMERSLDMVAGVLAVLKAGGYYVPLDPSWPADRVEAILGETGAPVVLTRAAHLGRVLEMQWRLPALSSVVCLDVEEPEPAPEPVDTESVRAVFDLLSERSVDRITAGGFVSSFTGLPFSAAEVDEYRDRVLGLAAPWIGPDKRVLEIGSGSGLLLWEIAPRVARCVGLDPSPLTQERNRARAADLGLSPLEVELPVGFAHEIEGWAEGSFDLVLIASTAQFFPGPLYLERVVKLAGRLLAPGGAVVVADVPDARRQEELRQAVDEHRLRQGLPMRQNPHKILSVDEDFFRGLGAAVHHRETGFDNELRYRYDVVLAQGAEGAPSRPKSLLTSWHVDRCAAERLPAVAGPEDLAYVIHTSGSTGQPKGIVVQHRPVANLIAWINPAFGLGPSDRVLFVTSLCFDLSVWDIFGVLAAGGCVHVASEEDLQDAERLMRILLEEPVTVWDSAPAALVRLAPLFPSAPSASSRLRRVMLSGDWISVTLPDRVRAAFPRAVVNSLGGATEATVWSNGYPVGEVDPGWPSIPYGRPMPNAQYHVLDGGFSPCPAGVPGDLYIGGDCLCVGYAHQPDLTAAAFIPDPFGAPGARIYKTGDRARYFADGNLEFLGRIDHQVKIRGFRIELGEIEVALARHPGVREALVLAREDVPGDKRLVAYVVSRPEAAVPMAELRGFLRSALPEYMVPAAFVELEALPVTANGKLDRRALPAPRWEREAAAGAEPGTPTERALATLWREILGVERVGVHDSFFDLGGHSLLATQLVARVREAFRVEMSLRTVFQAPALGEMAAALDAELAARGAGTAVTTPQVGEALREGPRPVLQPISRGGLFPLSFPQQRLWLVERLTPGTEAYHIPYAFRLRGPLDAPALATALSALVRRHEVLRTRFVERAGRPWQEILPPAPVDLTPEGLAEAELARTGREEAARPFDLAAASPFRARLARLGEEDHALFLTLHHIASDGWSEEILLGELSAFYEAAVTGVPAALPELPVQYADYAVWQRAWSEELLSAQLFYWTKYLAGVAMLELPTDRPRPPVQTFRGDSVPVAVPPAVAAALRGLAREQSATSFMLLLAAWQTLLHRLSGQMDVIVGSPVANRERAEVRGLIGFFVNLLPLRTGFDGAPGFAELLGRVRRTALEAYERLDVPFERLVDELALERDLSRHPLFQVLFSLRHGADGRLRLPGVEAAPLHLSTDVAKFDLSLWLSEEGEGFSGGIEFNSSLFDRPTVERLAGHFSHLLAVVAERPDLPVPEIVLPTAAERHQLLVEWNDTAVSVDAPAPLHAAFEARAAAAPDAVALVHGGRRVSYGELDARSDRLAALLRALGVGPEVRVGLCAARTPEMVVGVLGILKAGGAYAPLDPAYPAERLAFTLEDAEVTVLVTQEALLPILPVLPCHGARAVLLDGPEMEVSAARPDCRATADNLAYLIYTSGSTGRAKGVGITHRNAAEMVRWASGVFPPTDLAGVLASTSLCFDLSVFELFVPLSLGGTVILADNALELPNLPAAGEVTLINTVPSAVAELVRNGGIPPSVRTVNLAGEPLPGSLVAEIYERTGVERVINLYGPSEDTTYSTFAIAPRQAAAPAIGRPVDGTRAFVLDRGGRPAPLGAPGDLHLAGAGLARGYLERPDLTAERFVPDPFGGEPGGRLYRTGDLVRWLPDGMLRFLGRIDQQVKVRGFRIELGEVEAALARHPAVREAVVLARGQGGGRALVACVVPVEPSVLSAGGDLREALRSFLRQALPEPMVPSLFVLLESLPLMPNGKVDRKALAAIEPERGVAAREHVAPRTPAEELLAALWRDLLGVERIGLRDSFFDLGGHSLLASQLVARIRDAFGVEVSLGAVFQAPTLEALAGVVATSSPSFSGSGPVLRPVPRAGELPLSASQLRQWFLVQLEPGSVDYNLPVTVRLEGKPRVEALAAALRALVRRHETLRTTFVSAGGRPAAVVAPDIPLPLPVLDLSPMPAGEREAEATRVVVAESELPFDLARGPLLRALLIRLGEAEHLLAVTIHHIVFDGSSTSVFLRDLSALYQAVAAGCSADLPALPVQYIDYAAWQREWQESSAFAAKLERWQERLAGASRVLNLPTDRPRPAVLSLRGEMVTATVSAAAEIRKLAGREGATLFMVLLAGYASLLSRYTGQEDLNVGTFVANRTQHSLQRLIGFFVNTLVLRVDMTGDPSFRELLVRVRDMALDVFENQDVPFERLLDELEIGRDLSRGPLFQAMFGLQNFAMPTLEAGGLTFRPVGLAEHARVNGDIAFWMWEEGEELRSLLQLSTDLLDASTVVRMFGHMERLLAAGAADPTLRLSELPLLSAGETRQILVDWNRPGLRGIGDSEPDGLLHERFEAWARTRPEAPALATADGRETLGYGELNRRANRVAHRLRALGVGTDGLAGIWAERSVEFVVGVLGVLKAGGAYMPLDPSLPSDRLATLVRSSGLSVILTREGRPGGLPAALDCEIVPVRGLVPASPEHDLDPEPWAVGESLAYTFFTSGSTGTPKGVLISHSALANFAETTRRLYGIGPGDRVLQFSSLAFDISIEEIFTCWAAGGTLVLRSDEMMGSPARFLRACAELDVQMVDLPTAYWHELGIELAKGRVSLPACVRSVVFAGERALQERLEGWLPAMGNGVRLFNSYGPTEATPASSVYDPAEPVAGLSTNGLSIGRPMRGVRLYVVDPGLRPVPMGVAGELLIGGAGLGRGYAGRPDLTAERFVPSPFAELAGVPGERVYRTGDRVRWLRDGNLEFLGRVDDQVKIRGFRIEPGEVAAVLCRHPAVREAVVVPLAAPAGGLRLVVYAAVDSGASAAGLRDFLKDTLPAYMVPSDFVLLDALPLTSAGKLDRRALPAPEARTDDEGYAPPETAAEELLAEIWAGLLGRERVGIYDNFFDLGGHSLLAPQVFSRIEDIFQVELPLRVLFEAPTVAQLANLIEQELLAQIEELSDEEAESLVLSRGEGDRDARS
jgi:amino acid adenylation domain-containing protein